MITIEPNSHKPIYLQIVEGLQSEIAAGVYRPGEAIPSVRELALRIKVNPNTVQRAYEALERLDLIYSKRGIGKFVRKRATVSTQKHAETQTLQLFQQGLQLARNANISTDRVQELFEAARESVIENVDKGT